MTTPPEPADPRDPLEPQDPLTDADPGQDHEVTDAPAGPAGATPEHGGAARDEDALWRAIVENYGERARLDPDGPTTPAPTAGPPSGRTPARPGPPAKRPPARDLTGGVDIPEVPPSLRDLDGPVHREPPEDGEHFVPPPPPPVPLASPPRLLAWIGLFGVPVLVLVALVAGWPVPSWLGLLLTVWFVGGFVFLVASMRPGPRGEDDDGAVL
ncbi:MAG: hypothetical protein JWR20_2351 [Marmoricola sp.]|nr:hypothetical protein [Marmoricola sp.]